MSQFISPDPVRPDPIHLTRHPVDWEATDLAEGTARRVVALGDRLLSGCWYLNPRYTLSAPAPTAAFFAGVRDRRSAWLRTCRQSLSTPGQRRLAREARREGQRGPLAHLVPWAALSLEERREVVAQGHLAQGLAFGGILFIDGVLTTPQTWSQRADLLLGPEGSRRCRNRPRHISPPNRRPGRSISHNRPTPEASDALER